MSKLKVVATIMALVCITFLAASGTAKLQLNSFVDVAIGVGAMLSAVFAIFKKQ